MTEAAHSAGSRSLAARVGAFALHAKHDSRVLTAPARAAFLDRFLKEVDPDGVLPQEERVRRAEHARKAYFTRLALKSFRLDGGGRSDSPSRPEVGGTGLAAPAPSSGGRDSRLSIVCTARSVPDV